MVLPLTHFARPVFTYAGEGILETWYHRDAETHPCFPPVVVQACDHPDALREAILWRYDGREAWYKLRKAPERQPQGPSLRRSDGSVLVQELTRCLAALIASMLNQHRIPGLRVYLNPSAGGIKHGNAIVIIDPDGTWVREGLLKCAVVVGHGQGTLADHVRIR